MLKPECLNPKDVLMHLHSLGYHDITAQQMKEFLHDLKKLIKYEQKQRLQNTVKTESENTHSSECECSNLEFLNNSDKLSSNESYCESSVSSCSTSATYCRSSSKSDEINKHSTRDTADSDQLLTAHTSFIRPWNLKAPKHASNKGKKNQDPVRLYHQYKKYWDNQTIPGESKHSELRWVIRNKMLGQEPNPRVFVSNHKCFYS